MNEKHTPGPWTAAQVKGWGGDFCIITEDCYNPIFKAVKPKTYYTDYPPGKEPGSKILSSSLAASQGRYVATQEIQDRIDAIEAANSRLIAAAPELLEALEGLCGLAELRPGHLQDYKAAVASARAAIAKATGGQ